MDIRRLEIFCKVVDLKSFTRAAEDVLLSQPTVSEHIRTLEETCGDKLLDRLGREVLPTPAGKILYKYAKRIIALRDEAIQAIESHKGVLAGSLTIGASTIPGAYILPRNIEAFKSLHPSIRTTLMIAGSSETVDKLLHGDIELAIIGAKLKDHLLECRQIFADDLVLAVSPGHRLAKCRTISLSEMAAEPFLLRERGSGTRMVLTEALQNAGLDTSKLDVVAEIGSTEAIRQAIKAGLGVSILSSLAVAEDIRNGTLVTLPIEGVNITRPIFLVQRKNRQLTPVALSFLEHLLGEKQVGAEPPEKTS